MTLRMMWPLWLTLIVFLPLLVLAVWKIRTTHGERRRDWLRRGAIVLATAIIALTPAIPRTLEESLISNVEMYFVVDRTGSMAAEDYDGDRARLEGVQADLVALTQAMPAARYSILAFDSQTTSQLPLTTDSRAVRAWADTVKQEITAYSAGSSIDRPLEALTETLNGAAERNPENVRLVFIFSDGENTNGSDSQAGGDFASFADLEPLVDGGAVLGYGTAEGGNMRSYDGTSETGFGTDAPYITDENGEPGVSQIDETNLRTLADQLGIDYTHRITEDPVDQLVEGVDVQEIASDGRRDLTTYEDVYWPFAIVLGLLLAWEAWDLTREVPKSGRKRPKRDDGEPAREPVGAGHGGVQ
ncbi:vWA domain-containing protein [Ruania halotolerans]|uniref:vWA domain-containing protein n=1 Tax=Ruania halotolerans TaxID=2897773 RepID=UPI001E3D0A65|nr:vWA domain-containing protein [Ruania halotolerans]UFU06275.1 VWA domain-containing protein [Ruania halotolerans]